MPHELLGKHPAADDRKRMGRFLRDAFPLGLGSFAELPNTLKGNETSGETAREVSQNDSGLLLRHHPVDANDDAAKG